MKDTDQPILHKDGVSYVLPVYISHLLLRPLGIRQ